jgi:hypothetical protein
MPGKKRSRHSRNTATVASSRTIPKAHEAQLQADLRRDVSERSRFDQIREAKAAKYIAMAQAPLRETMRNRPEVDEAIKGFCQMFKHPQLPLPAPWLTPGPQPEAFPWPIPNPADLLSLTVFWPPYELELAYDDIVPGTMGEAEQPPAADKVHGRLNLGILGLTHGDAYTSRSACAALGVVYGPPLKAGKLEVCCSPRAVWEDIVGTVCSSVHVEGHITLRVTPYDLAGLPTDAPVIVDTTIRNHNFLGPVEITDTRIPDVVSAETATWSPYPLSLIIPVDTDHTYSVWVSYTARVSAEGANDPTFYRHAKLLGHAVLPRIACRLLRPPAVS